MNTSQFKYFRFIQYGSILLLSFFYFFQQGPHYSLLLALLLYAIQSQVRWFYLSQRQGLFIFSVLLEYGLAFYLQKYLGAPFFIYLYMPLLDSIFDASFLKRNITNALAFLASVVYFFQSPSPGLFISNLLVLFTISFLSQFLTLEQSKKQEAQVLYDRLRESEEALLQLNQELEGYAYTIEELTLYRERHRISRELHDNVGHTLATLIIQLQAVKSLLSKKSRFEDADIQISEQKALASNATCASRDMQIEQATDMLALLISFTKDALETTRHVIHQMKPMEFEALAGIFAIEKLSHDFEKMTNIHVKFILSKEKWPINDAQSHHLYRIVQEFLTNSAKYSQASEIVLSIQFLENKLHVQLRDNGIGCEPCPYGFGLKGIEERIHALAGSMTIFSKKNEGFELTFDLPKNTEIL